MRRPWSALPRSLTNRGTPTTIQLVLMYPYCRRKRCIMRQRHSITVVILTVLLSACVLACTAQAAPPSDSGRKPAAPAAKTCATCSGTSSITCKHCGGNDQTRQACEHCRGKGSLKTPCWHCKGRDLTEQTCRFCRGRDLTKQPCPNCRGKDLTQQKCPLCRGKGVYKRSQCLGCRGSGKKDPCDCCKGSGKAPACVYCRGEGKQPPCIHCKGTGRSSVCLQCSGTGKKPPCVACKGKGSLPCPKCVRQKVTIVRDPTKTPKDPKPKVVREDAIDDKTTEPDKASDPRGYYLNESTYLTLRNHSAPRGLANLRIPLAYLNGQAVENGSYSDLFFKRTGDPGTVYIQGYYRENGRYVRSHYRSNASMMFTARPPSLSTYDGTRASPQYYGQTSPTGQLRGAVNVRGYYRTRTMPQWHVRSRRLP